MRVIAMALLSLMPVLAGAQSLDRSAFPPKQPVGVSAYSGEFSVADLLAAEMDRYSPFVDLADGAATFSVEITTDVVKDGVRLVKIGDQKLSRLGAANLRNVSSSITIPLQAADYLRDDVFLRDAFLNAVVEQTKLIQLSAAATSSGATPTNCGRMGVGSAVMTSWGSPSFGTIETTYSCFAASEAEASWIVLVQKHEPQAESMAFAQ